MGKTGLKTPHFVSKPKPQPPQEFTDLCSKGYLKQAFTKFKALIWSNPNHFSILIQSTIPTYSLPLAKQLHALTISSGCSSDKFLSNHLLNLYTKLSQMPTSISILRLMPIKNVMSYNILINGYFQESEFDSARNLFDEMPKRNVASWNAMVNGFTQSHCSVEALTLFSEMHVSGFLPDEFTLGSVLRNCAALKALNSGREAHGYVSKSGLECNLVVGSSLAHMYMRSGKLEEGEKVLRLMPVWSVVSVNTLIAGKSQHGIPKGALDEYSMMKTVGFRPDKITFVSVISSCSELATIGQGRQIHADVVKSGAESEVSVMSSLVSMYSRCGCLEDSERVFLEYSNPDMVSWSAMIAAYGFHGKGGKAIDTFEKMVKRGLEANEVTFLSLLYACSHCGLKEKGVEFFDSMIVKYYLTPKLEHYTCMVDLLGRCGHLEDAEAMIKSMPMKPDAIIWKTLLSACKTHKNADMARRIADEVLKLNPRDSAPYVILSNIHASDRSWGDVSRVRKAMKDRNVKKEPGVSWLELKNNVHQFCMSDKSHPDSDMIDAYLKELTAEIKSCGYVPDTNSVLHDMTAEDREYNLSRHSERVAVAFALMNTQKGIPIRVMKNFSCKI